MVRSPYSLLLALDYGSSTSGLLSLFRLTNMSLNVVDEEPESVACAQLQKSCKRYGHLCSSEIDFSSLFE